MKYEVKGLLLLFSEIELEDLLCHYFVGVDEEMKNIPDMEKKLEQMDDNGDEFDFDDDDEDIPDIGFNFKEILHAKNYLFDLI
jgi:hypothetical protein